MSVLPMPMSVPMPIPISIAMILVGILSSSQDHSSSFIFHRILSCASSLSSCQLYVRQDRTRQNLSECHPSPVLQS